MATNSIIRSTINSFKKKRMSVVNNANSLRLPVFCNHIQTIQLHRRCSNNATPVKGKLTFENDALANAIEAPTIPVAKFNSNCLSFKLGNFKPKMASSHLKKLPDLKNRYDFNEIFFNFIEKLKTMNSAEYTHFGSSYTADQTNITAHAVKFQEVSKKLKKNEPKYENCTNCPPQSQQDEEKSESFPKFPALNSILINSETKNTNNKNNMLSTTNNNDNNNDDINNNDFNDGEDGKHAAETNMGSISTSFSTPPSSQKMYFINPSPSSQPVNLCLCPSECSYLPNPVLYDFYELMREDSEFTLLSYEHMVLLRNAVCNFLFLTPKEIENRYVYADSYVPLQRKNWIDVEVVYKLMYYLLKYEKDKNTQSYFIDDNDQKALKDDVYSEKFVNEKFIQNLVKLLNSPDSNEQKSIELIIVRVYILFPIYKSIVLKALLYLLDTTEQSYCIDPALRMVGTLIKNCKQTKQNCQKCVIKFLNLFKFEQLQTFYDSLNCVLYKMYECKEDEVIPMALMYLKNHWPVINSKKQFIFLSHCLCVLRDFNVTIDDKISNFIIKKLHYSLISDNVMLCKNTTELIMDADMLAQLKTYDEKILNKILFDLHFEMEKNWSGQFQPRLEQASAVVRDLIKDADDNCYEAFQFKDETDNRSAYLDEKWKKIIS